ncbi:amidohydrolase [Photobacterium sanguinicancri]|uniref:amidohydrolase n=1 Tax=Photobacterium sanguinicancri TaxID=875932 RepID=UPI003D1319AC
MKKLVSIMLSVIFVSTPTWAEVIADKVFKNAKVYTMDESMPWAEAVAIKGGKIIYVGASSDVDNFVGVNTELYDLKNKMLLPGFVSGHDHLVASNWTKAGVNLFSGKSKDDYLKLVKDWADAHPDDEFLYGYGWSYTTHGGIPTAKELDSVAPNHKVILFDFTIHDAWLNSAMLEAGGINKNTKDKQPGFSYWHRDEQGNPVGAAVELSWFPAYLKSGAWNREKLVVESQKTLYDNAASQGWTSVINVGLVTPNISIIDANIDEYEFAMDLLHKLEKSGDLKLRTFMHMMYKNGEWAPKKAVEQTLAFKKRYNSDMLRMAGLKVHPEANWGTETSLLLKDYTSNPGYKGIRGISAERVDEVILAANAESIDVSIHVDGSATAEATIDSILKSRKQGNKDERNSLQHFAVVNPKDMKRAVDNLIPINMTPIWRTDWGNGYQLALAKLGKNRAHNTFQMLADAFENGNHVSISADVPSTPAYEAGALFLIESAMTRKNPNDPESKAWPPKEQAITLEQGLKAVTILPAWQARMEDKIGSLEVGKYADMVILENNLFDLDADEIGEAKVLGTLVEGEFTFKDGL